MPENKTRTEWMKLARAVLVLVLACASFAVAQRNNSLQYFYDDIGRLTKVIDSSGNVATYTYDAIGNILKITRSSIAPTALAILNFAPQQGGVGTTVTIQGQGFNATAAQNAVTINGSAATVVSATVTSLVITVPTGATTGPISVTANGQTASSDRNFTVIQAPAILSINPKVTVSSSVA